MIGGSRLYAAITRLRGHDIDSYLFRGSGSLRVGLILRQNMDRC